MSSFGLTVSGLAPFDIQPPEEAVEEIGKIPGRVTAYYWYEGAGQGNALSVKGAKFARNLLSPLIGRLGQNLRLYLYSLKPWSFNHKATELPLTSKLQDRINELLGASGIVKTLSAAKFFTRFCFEGGKDPALQKYVEHCNRDYGWLNDLSRGFREKKVSVSTFFDGQPNLFECVQTADVESKYALMQNVEGYFLIERAVNKELKAGNRQINIVFLLPNDEGKYYRNFPQDLRGLLSDRFGSAIDGTDIDVRFVNFQYSDSARPYLPSSKEDRAVKASEIKDYLPAAPAAAEPERR